MFSIDKKTVIQMMKDAFDAGEQWGVTYSTWFTPTTQDTDERKHDALNSIPDSYNFSGLD